MKSYKISEIAKLSGVTVKAIRVYEGKGLLSPTRQSESNYRLYSIDTISKIRNIKLLQNLGFSLKEISIIHSNKELQHEDLRIIFQNQLKGTMTQLTHLEERKIILSNIIKKIDEGVINSSSLLTAREKDVFMGITTGFSKLDQLLLSESRDQLIVIAARPGMGKTALTVHIAYNLLEQTNLPICFYSTEFDHSEWAERLAIQKCEVDRYDKNLSVEKREELNRAREEILSKSIYFRHDREIGIEEVIENTLEVKKSLGAIVIDYYQDISGDAKTKCLKLKELASKVDCPVLVISTVKQEVDERENQTPRPEDLHDYSTIRENFDKLLIVSRDPKLELSKSRKIANINVYSNGHAKSKDISLVWDGSYCGYSETL